jgi:hypothetical protein
VRLFRTGGASHAVKSTLVAAALVASVGLSAQPPPPSIAGYVLTPDWLPVSSGTVVLKSVFSERVVSIGADGRFRLDGVNPGGPHDLSVSAPGLITRRLQVMVPHTGLLILPPVQLSAGSYLRMQVVAPSRQPLESARVIGQSYDLSGARIPERAGESLPFAVEPNGRLTIGPLPPGMFVSALEAPPFARMRLRDVHVTGERLLDFGTVVAQEGAELNVEVVDGTGEPVPNHEVYLEEGTALSPLWSPPVRTDATGRATFTRVASGRHHVRTRGIAPCGGDNMPPTIGRAIDMPDRGTVEKTLVIGGTLSVRLLSSGGQPLPARWVAVTPGPVEPALPAWLRQSRPSIVFQSQWLGRLREAPCGGLTDSTGRVKLPNVPPGPARLAVRLGHSTWSRRLEVPEGGEVVLEIPTGVLSVRILDSSTGNPIGGAAITWTSGGGRVESGASVTGEALLEGVFAGPGVLAVEAQSYRRRTLKFAAPPDVLQELALVRSVMSDLNCRVMMQDGEPLEGAVVELAPHDPSQTPQIATTDREGFVRFVEPPSGPLRLIARAGGYATARIDTVPFSELQTGTHATVRMAPGYRVVVAAEAALEEGAHPIHIMNYQGERLDALLDAASDRTVRGGGRVSLGPLPHGMYIIGLRTAAGERTEQVAIRGRDVEVKLR